LIEDAVSPIRDTEVEHVEQFTYLGSIISTTGGTDEDIKARKRKAQQAFVYFRVSGGRLICLSGVDSHRFLSFVD
jgi:hypothetical protein